MWEATGIVFDSQAVTALEAAINSAMRKAGRRVSVPRKHVVRLLEDYLGAKGRKFGTGSTRKARVVPKLSEARKAFEAQMKGTIEWGDL